MVSDETRVTGEMKAEGWIEHDGGLCPIVDSGIVEVRLRGGRVTFSRFGFWCWDERAPLNIDIVAWRPTGAQMEIAA